MQKIIITLFLTLFISLSLHAGENYSEMSTQELISIIGYVKKDKQKEFKQELKSRVPKMSASEKKVYQENLQKLK